MKIPVLIEPVPNNGYRAKGGAPFVESAEGATAEEALANLELALHRRLTGEVRLVALDVPDVAMEDWSK